MGQQLRLELQALLKTLEENVYFQPPDNSKIQYPCIVYARDNSYRASADNVGYRYKQRYQLTAISRDPDNPVVDKLVYLPLCSYQRGFAADGLTHDVFELYF